MNPCIMRKTQYAGAEADGGGAPVFEQHRADRPHRVGEAIPASEHGENASTHGMPAAPTLPVVAHQA